MFSYNAKTLDDIQEGSCWRCEACLSEYDTYSKEMYGVDMHQIGHLIVCTPCYEDFDDNIGEQLNKRK